MIINFLLANIKITKTLIQNGADMTIPNKNGESVVDLSLNNITRGLATIWFGVREMVKKSLNTLRDPMTAIKRSNFESINFGPHIKISFEDRPQDLKIITNNS